MGRGATMGLLAALATALIAALILGGRDSSQPKNRRLFPGFDPDAIRSLALDPRGEPSVRLVRDEGGAFALREPQDAPADPDAVRDLLGALEMLAYQRQVDEGRGLERPRGRIRARAEDDHTWELAIGDPIEASDQVWLRRGDEIFVAEGHRARALLTSAEELRERRPFRDLDVASRLSIEAEENAAKIEFEAPPRIEFPEGGVRADPTALGALLRELRQLEIQPSEGATEPRDSSELPLERIGVEGDAEAEARLVATGTCSGGDLAVRTQLGAGCIAREDAKRLAARARDPEALVDRRLVGDPDAAIETISIRKGEKTLTLRWEGDRFLASSGEEVEAPQVRRVLRELSGAAGALRRLEGDARLLARIDIERRRVPDDTLRISRDAQGLFAAREGEPLGFSLSEGALRLLRAGLLAFRPRALIERERHALRELSRRRAEREIERVVRGELAGDYEAETPQGASLRPDVLDRAAETLARLRAEAFDAQARAPRHGLSPPRFEIALAFDPAPLGPAEPERHRVEVGGAASGGCYARVDEGPVAILAAEDCEALAARWTEAPEGP